MSRFFLFHIISFSVFSCSASEKQLTQDLSQQIINYTPIINRLAKGESGADIVLSIARGTVNVVETVRQGYQNLSNSPTTQAVITNAQAGAETLATHTYSAGVTLCTATHNLLQWAYNQRYQQDSLTFKKAVTRYNQQMYSIMYSELSASDKKECQQSIIKSLTTIKTDISTITELINITKGITENNSSGIRTTIIDHVIADITSDKKITEKKAQDYINIINEIAKFSKTEDGENNLEESTLEPAVNDGKQLLDGKQLFSELEKEENLENNVFSAFIQKYMSNNSDMKATLKNKKNQNTIKDTNQDALPIEELKKIISAIELQNKEMTEITRLKQTEIEQYQNNIFQLTNEIQGHQKALQHLTSEKAKLAAEKQTLSETITRQGEQLRQEKAALESKIQQLWTFIKIGSSVITVSAIAILMCYFKLHEQCIALLR